MKKKKIISGILFLLSVFYFSSCSSDKDGIQKSYKGVPSCSEIGLETNDKVIFTQALFDESLAEYSLIYGGMFPDGREVTPNFEMGYGSFTQLDVPLFWPGEVYVISIESTQYTIGDRAGQKDYGVAFVGCASSDRLIQGNFAHVTGLAGQVKALLEDNKGDVDCRANEGSPEGTIDCSYNLQGKPFKTTAGDPLGFAGGKDDLDGDPNNDYRPGLDLNILDTSHEVKTINRDRQGGESGEAVYFRYGACIHDYFSDPFKSQMLAKTGLGVGAMRVSPDHPCGVMEVDVAGTPAGMWIQEDKENIKMRDVPAYSDDFVDNVLVLALSPVKPNTHMVLSTRHGGLSLEESTDVHRLVEFERQSSGYNNVTFSEMEEDTIYCLHGGVNSLPELSYYYYLLLTNGGELLQIERLDADCQSVEQNDRSFGGDAIRFIR